MDKFAKRIQKESIIIDAAEKVFMQHGYDNTKMEDIAKELGMSKGTIYFYMGSKENLYMAITHRGMQRLIDEYHQISFDNKENKGVDAVIALMKAFMEFSQEHFLYTEAVLNYLSFSRSTGRGLRDDKVTSAMRESLYYQKVLMIEDAPMQIVIKEIRRGVEDGSIRNNVRPELIYLNAWALILGFTKLNDTATSNTNKILRIDVETWKDNILEESRKMISKY